MKHYEFSLPLDLPHRDCHQNIDPVVIRMDSPVSFLSIKHDTEAVRTSLMWEVTRSTRLSMSESNISILGKEIAGGLCAGD
jgi:hypothetical protein